jgi:hypothetical protein
MPLDAPIRPVFAPFCPGGRHGHRFRFKNLSCGVVKSLFKASIQKWQNGPSTCHRPWYIGGKVSRWISRFAKIALRWCKQWQTVTWIFRHIITDDDRWQILYVVRSTTYYTAFPRRIAASSSPKDIEVLNRGDIAVQRTRMVSGNLVLRVLAR